MRFEAGRDERRDQKGAEVAWQSEIKYALWKTQNRGKFAIRKELGPLFTAIYREF